MTRAEKLAKAEASQQAIRQNIERLEAALDRSRRQAEQMIGYIAGLREPDDEPTEGQEKEE